MQASAPSPPARLPDRVWRRPAHSSCRAPGAMYKTVLLSSPLSPPPYASLSFSLHPPSAIRPQRRAAASTMSQFPPPTTTRRPIPQMPYPLLPPSCARGRSPFAGHARAREPLLILLTLPIEPTCPLALADPLSIRASTKLSDTSHAKPAPSTPLRKQAPLDGHVASCRRRRESRFTKISVSFPESGYSCSAESAPSSNERNIVPACPGHVSAG